MGLSFFCSGSGTSLTGRFSTYPGGDDAPGREPGSHLKQKNYITSKQ